MLKRFTIALIALFAISAAASARNEAAGKAAQIPNYKNSLEISFTPGPLSIMKLGVYGKLANFDAMVPYSDLLLGKEATGLLSSGNVTLGYMRRMNDWLWLGGVIGFETVTLEMMDLETWEFSQNDISAIPVMAMAKADWFRRPHARLYSKLGLGAAPTFVDTGANKFKMAFQLTPIAVEFGGNHVFGFVEAGFGLQGVLIAGMRFPF